MKFKKGMIVRYYPNKSMSPFNGGPGFITGINDDYELKGKQIKIKDVNSQWIKGQIIDFDGFIKVWSFTEECLQYDLNMYLATNPINKPERNEHNG